MPETKVNLTEQEQNALDEISRRTGKTQSELIHQAVEQLISECQVQECRLSLRKAKGMWKERQDLPILSELRQEWDRF